MFSSQWNGDVTEASNELKILYDLRLHLCGKVLSRWERQGTSLQVDLKAVFAMLHPLPAWISLFDISVPYEAQLVFPTSTILAEKNRKHNVGTWLLPNLVCTGRHYTLKDQAPLCDLLHSLRLSVTQPPCWVPPQLDPVSVLLGLPLYRVRVPHVTCRKSSFMRGRGE